MPDNPTVESADIKNTKWRHLLDEIRQWTSESPEWKFIQAFFTEVQVIAEEKHRDRQKRRRDDLHIVLDRLLTNFREDLAFFELTDAELAYWIGTRCPDCHVSELVEIAQGLQAQLSKRRELSNRNLTNYQEARRLRVTINDVENRILSLIKEVRHGLAVDLPTEPSGDAKNQETSQQIDAPRSKRDEKERPIGARSSQESEPDTTDSGDTIAGADSEPVTESSDRSIDDEYTTATERSSPSFDRDVILPSLPNILNMLAEDESDEHWTKLTWRLIEDGDLTGAYWLTRSLAATHKDVPVSPEVLGVLQGSRLLENDTDNLVFDIAKIVSETELRSKSGDRQLGMAAALFPSLVAPNSGLINWLPQKTDVTGPIGEIAESVRSFASYGHALRTEDTEAVRGTASQERSIESVTRRARGLLESFQGRRLKIRRATNVWRFLTSKKGDLCVLLAPVIENNVEESAQVREQIVRLSSRQKIVSRVNQIEREVLKHSRAAPPITGDALEQLVRGVQDVGELCLTWCRRVELEETIVRRGDWWSGVVFGLRQQIESVLPEAAAELEQMRTERTSLGQVAIASTIEQSLGRVQHVLGL